MFPGCPERCNAEGTHSEYSPNIACWLGIIWICFRKKICIEQILGIKGNVFWQYSRRVIRKRKRFKSDFIKSGKVEHTSHKNKPILTNI